MDTAVCQGRFKGLFPISNVRAGNIWRGGLTYINFRSHRPFQGHSRDRRPIHVGFMVDKVALGQFFDRVLQCCPLRIVQLDTCITRKCEKTLGGGGWGEVREMSAFELQVRYYLRT